VAKKKPRQSEASNHPTREAFDAVSVRGQSATITSVVNALEKAGVELGGRMAA
jgi:hypothetical protein